MDVGAEINQYKIVEHIGRGGMADVWSARDNRLNRMVAIKTIVHGLSGDVDPVALFRREAQTIAGIEHPHILPIYDFGEIKGKLYIVMRYLPGGALSDRLETGPLTPQQVLRFGKAVAQALDFAHENKVVHLDLKPQNILLDSHETPYLADFGLAAVLDPEGRAQNPGSGTLVYMAPEQLTAEVLDQRADIYSFGILLYHMFTGLLPYDGQVPLALRQLQNQGDLPELENFPPYVTTLLRQLTAVNPTSRPEKILAVMEEIETVLSDAVELQGSAGLDGLDDDWLAVGQIVDSDDLNLLEAVDIYSRARHAWAGGQGRFLLGVTHFMLMNDYYMQAEKHGLELDADGKQMLLRGALEYDRDIDYWWDQQDDASRRWVCLHAIRSANAPARIRALYRIETLPDADPPRIPRLVAQALQAETDTQARIAALQVLATRARLMKPHREYDIKTEYRGRMLSSLTRFELQVLPATEWQENVYSPEIDTLLAQVALDTMVPEVSDFAARVIGRIRSKTAVRYIAKQQRMRQEGALRALALVRDEAPNLPEVVTRGGRWYAWLANTWRRLTDEPLKLTWRFLFAVLGGWLGMGWQVYTTYRSEAVLAPDRIANTISFGLAFGVFVGVAVLLADEIPARLRGFWLRWQRLLLSVLLGVGAGMLSWGLATWMYLRQNPNWDLMLLGGFGLAMGFILNAMLHLRGWLAALVTAVSIFLSVYAPFNNYCQYIAACPQSPGFSVAPFGLIGLVIGVFAGIVFRSSQRPENRFRLPVLASLPLVQSGLAVLLGLIWTLVIWGIYAVAFAAAPTTLPWVAVVGFSVFGIFSAGLLTYLLDWLPRQAFAAAAVATFLAVYFLVNPILITVNSATESRYGFAPEGYDTLLYYDANQDIFSASGLVVYDRLFTSGAAFAILIALGGHAMSIGRDVRRQWQRRRAQVEAVPLLEPVKITDTTETPAPKPVSKPVNMMTQIIELGEPSEIEDMLATVESPSVRHGTADGADYLEDDTSLFDVADDETIAKRPDL